MKDTEVVQIVGTDMNQPNPNSTSAQPSGSWLGIFGLSTRSYTASAALGEGGRKSSRPMVC